MIFLIFVCFVWIQFLSINSHSFNNTHIGTYLDLSGVTRLNSESTQKDMNTQFGSAAPTIHNYGKKNKIIIYGLIDLVT